MTTIFSKISKPVAAATSSSLSQLYLHGDIESFPETALHLLLSLTVANAGSFFLWDEYRKEFCLKAVIGPQKHRIAESRIKLREGIVGIVGGQGNSILVKNIHGDQRFVSIKRNGTYRSPSFISIPLLQQNKIIGVINLTEKNNLIAFDEEDFQIAQEFCSHTAVAYSNLRQKKRFQTENQLLHDTIAEMKCVQKENEPFVAIGKLAANLTHELNNPLDAIRRYVNLAIEQSMGDSLTHEYLLKAKKGIRRAIRVIRHLLHYSHAHKTNVQVADIHEVIDQSLEAVVQDSAFQKIKIVKDYAPETVRIMDRGLSIVIYNLCQNAQQAMNGEGVLTLSTRKKNRCVLLSVEDTGVGIPEEIRTKLFEPFFSTKNQGQGMGLGLTICRDIIQRSSGSIECESSAGKGARFTVALPIQF